MIANTRPRSLNANGVISEHFEKQDPHEVLCEPELNEESDQEHTRDSERAISLSYMSTDGKVQNESTHERDDYH